MSALAMILAFAVAAGPFVVQSIPLAGPDDLVFLAHGKSSHAAGVFVLHDRVLQGHFSESEAGRVELPEATTAFDVADLDADGRSEVIAVCGERVLLFEFSIYGDDLDEGLELFQAPSLLSARSMSPSPYVLATTLDEEVAIVLPCEGALEARGLDGALLGRYDVEVPGEEGDTFIAEVTPRAASSLSGLDMRICRVSELAIPPTSEMSPFSKPVGSTPRALPQEGQSGDYVYWPWFPLKPRSDGGSRVLYTVACSGVAETCTRVCEVVSGTVESPEPSVKVRALRRYPGAILVDDEGVADFNGDGFADLVLWKAPEPGMSVDSIMRAAAGKDWPLHISIHLFLPDTMRHDPRPSGHLTGRVPITWLLGIGQAAPVRNLVIRDLDGDGRSDVGLSMSDDQFSIWISGPAGFAAKPDLVHAFPERIDEVAFCADLDGSGVQAIGLRTARTVQVIRAPRSTPPVLPAVQTP